MAYTDYYFDIDFAQSLYEQHLFAFAPGNDCADGSAFRVAFLLWLTELSQLPSVQHDQITRLLLWSKECLHFECPLHPQHLVESLNSAWREIFLQPRKQNNPALCLLVLKSINAQYSYLTLQKLSKQLELNPSYLSRVISSDLKCSFPNLLQCRRLLTAVDSLRSSRYENSIEDIASELGYSSPHYFYCVFKSFTGLTPVKARNVMMLF